MPHADPSARSEYLRNYRREWMRRRRQAYFAGKACVRCGETERLELDHIDRATKEHHAIWSWSQVRREAELAKCQVLCYWCHKEKTRGELSKPITHGTDAGYTRRCRCADCTAAHARYQREYRSRGGVTQRGPDRSPGLLVQRLPTPPCDTPCRRSGRRR